LKANKKQTGCPNARDLANGDLIIVDSKQITREKKKLGFWCMSFGLLLGLGISFGFSHIQTFYVYAREVNEKEEWELLEENVHELEEEQKEPVEKEEVSSQHITSKESEEELNNETVAASFSSGQTTTTPNTTKNHSTKQDFISTHQDDILEQKETVNLTFDQNTNATTNADNSNENIDTTDDSLIDYLSEQKEGTVISTPHYASAASTKTLKNLEGIDHPQTGSLTLIRCTGYIDVGHTRSGEWTRNGVVAGRYEWLGKKCKLYQKNQDGSVGEYIGTFEFLDTGYGINASLEKGTSIDVWHPSMESLEEWLKLYGDYVYIEFL